jgi:hypothetical protein
VIFDFYKVGNRHFFAAAPTGTTFGPFTNTSTSTPQTNVITPVVPATANGVLFQWDQALIYAPSFTASDVAFNNLNDPSTLNFSENRVFANEVGTVQQSKDVEVPLGSTRNLQLVVGNVQISGNSSVGTLIQRGWVENIEF